MATVARTSRSLTMAAGIGSNQQPPSASARDCQASLNDLAPILARRARTTQLAGPPLVAGAPSDTPPERRLRGHRHLYFPPFFSPLRRAVADRPRPSHVAR